MSHGGTSLNSDQYFAALRADIAEHGVLVPIVVDDHGDVLDGHHRQLLAGELGLPCPSRLATAEERASGVYG